MHLDQLTPGVKVVGRGLVRVGSGMPEEGSVDNMEEGANGDFTILLTIASLPTLL